MSQTDRQTLRRSVLRWSIIASLAACTADPDGSSSDRRFALSDVNVVDVRSGRILPHRSIIIEGDFILAVQAASEPLDEAITIIPGAGRYVTPALWDMHVHVADEHYLDLFIANGITGVRDMGGGLDRAGDGCESLQSPVLRRWRADIDSGARIGPELVISGRTISGTGWPTSLAARSAQEAESAVAALRRDEVDFIKVYERLSVPAFGAMAEAARSNKLAFAGHLSDEVGPIAAIAAGQRSIEHVRDPILVCFTASPSELEGFMVDDGWNEADRTWGRAAHSSCPALIDAFRTHAVWLTPTLTVEKSKVSIDDQRHVDDSRRRLLPGAVQQGYATFVRRKRAQTRLERLSEQRWWRTQQRLVARMSREGVRMLAGTDSACEGVLPGVSLHQELAELVAAGLSPLEALRSATIEPARYLGRTNQGEVRPQQGADLLLLDGNPLEDIRQTRRIRAVIVGGRLLPRRKLDQLLSR